jgi:NAD-dependent SIR2 family protein deacetylase
MDNKYLLLQYDKRVSHSENECMVNEKVVPAIDGDTRSATDRAIELNGKFYEDFLKKHFRNIIVLTGAGTSMDNGVRRGKTKDGLWSFCIAEIDAFEPYIVDFKIKEFYKSKDIEGLLSYVILFEKLNGGIKDVDAVALKKALERKIAEACRLDLDVAAPHTEFLNKIAARKSSDPRVQLFTTNYDLLFEQASNEAGFIVVDGFSFTQPRRFSGRYFDFDMVNREKTRLKQEESFVSKVIHLYKIHGSLNWYKEGSIIQQKDTPEEPLIIYPAGEKYESSY